MATRVTAALALLVAFGIAWLAITAPFAARLLQAIIVVSMAYVAWLAWKGWRVMRFVLADATGPGVEGDRPRPFVSLVVPARNEAGGVAGTVRALADMRYAGADGVPRYELVVVDDGSTDATGPEATAAAAGQTHIRVRRREPGGGPRTKGAVLAWAMPELHGDVIGAIDADTRVDTTFLDLVMRAWARDPDAAALQVARRCRNSATSWLTRAQEEEQLMDMTSQCGRWATDGTAELRGNGMFVRRTALEGVGGWGERALTEDLELSTRLAAAGHRVTLAPEVAVNEEAVESLGALWRQRMRWAEGSLRRLLEHGPGLVVGPQPLGRKLDFLAFASEFAVPPLFAAAVVASLLTIPLPGAADWTVPASLALAYGVGILALALAGLHASGERGAALIGRGLRGSLFLMHWLVVVPVVLVRIAFGPETTGFDQTPRFIGDEG
ncbi:MAG TPA: glycosyltransferase family 2 protein [Candidatus Limnocylindria bacterium]|jgi:1,2-diacylglycerol 3-beta-glucosyltransferase